jgi:PEP-CTERM motif
MKRVTATFIVIAFVLSMAALTASATTSVTYNGTVNPFQLGGTATTNVAQFDSSMGTLTGVTIDLSLTVTPYAMVMNFGSQPVEFTTSDSIIFGYTPADIWTISHGSDIWTLAAPTVSTGTMYGSGQMVQPGYLNGLTLPGSNSAPVNLMASALSANLAQYVGTDPLSLLIFGTEGAGQVSITDGSLYGGGGGNLTGNISVTYEYTPEPATMCLLGLGAFALRRKK